MTAVARILKNPKYTGRVVLGRTRNTGSSHRKGERKTRAVPRAYWTWADDNCRHPELISMELWEQAQEIGAERGNVRDAENPTPASQRRTLYPLRARIRCNTCKRRMHGITRPGRRPGQTYVYYLCPHDPKNPRHAEAYPEHTRTSINDDIIAAALTRFADQYLLGHDRAAMLAVQLPAGTAEQTAQRDRQAAALRKKLAKIETAQKGLITQIEQLGDDTSPGKRALRDRITEQYGQRHEQHAALTTELEALTTLSPDDADTADPALLDELPYPPACSTRHQPPSARPSTPPSTSTASTATTKTRSPSGLPSPTPPPASSRR